MANPSKNDALLADKKSNPLIGLRQAFIADPTGGATIDAEARAVIVLILNVLEEHGLMASS